MKKLLSRRRASSLAAVACGERRVELRGRTNPSALSERYRPSRRRQVDRPPSAGQRPTAPNQPAPVPDPGSARHQAGAADRQRHVRLVRLQARRRARAGRAGAGLHRRHRRPGEPAVTDDRIRTGVISFMVPATKFDETIDALDEARQGPERAHQRPGRQRAVRRPAGAARQRRRRSATRCWRC